jgi:5-methylcytosine-specific restriction endonuclease McrA
MDELRPTVDHVMPKAEGGILSKKNKVHACADCNSLKGDMNIDQFILAIDAMQRLNHNDYQRQKAYLRKVKKSCINLKQIKR